MAADDGKRWTPKKPEPKKVPEPTAFMKEHMPVLPDFVTANMPKLKFDPTYTLGPPVQSVGNQSLLDAYFGGDARHLYADMLSRREHYEAEQKEIIERLYFKKPLDPTTTRADIDEIVLRYFDKSEQRKKREEVLKTVQKKLDPDTDDPTVKRKLQEEKEREEQEAAKKLLIFGDAKNAPKAIKII